MPYPMCIWKCFPGGIVQLIGLDRSSPALPGDPLMGKIASSENLITLRLSILGSRIRLIFFMLRDVLFISFHEAVPEASRLLLASGTVRV